MLIVGFGALIQGVLRLGNPAQAVEKTGWLYQQFGDQGVAIGMIAMGGRRIGHRGHHVQQHMDPGYSGSSTAVAMATSAPQ